MNKFTNYIIDKIQSYIINPVKDFISSTKKRLGLKDNDNNDKKNILHYNFYEQIKNKDYNESYIKINEGKFCTYRFDYVEYLRNPKILTPDLIENKTFLIRAFIYKDEIRTKTTISNHAKKISQYNYFINHVFSELILYTERCAQSEIEVNFLDIEISVWQ